MSAFICMYVCMFVCVGMCRDIHICMRTHIHTNTYVYVSENMVVAWKKRQLLKSRGNCGWVWVCGSRSVNNHIYKQIYK